MGDAEGKDENWKEKALERQQELYERLGDRRWDMIQSGERWALESKVGFAMFGEPTEDNTDTRGYTKEKYDEVTKICDLIYEVRGYPEVLVAFIFLIGRCKEDVFTAPVFRVMNRYGESNFIDQLGRVYESWSHFKENNKLPVCEFSYPWNGIYEAGDDGHVLASFAKSPASSFSARALSAMDVTSSVATLTAATVGVASLFVPVAGPVIAAAALSSAGCGIYGLGRGSYELVDRRKHQQTISPLDSSARNCWLSVLGVAFGVGSGLAMKGLITKAISGGVLSTAGVIAVEMLKIGTLTVIGFGLANWLGHLIEKNKKGELTNLDLMQFTSYVFFFTNAEMNTKTARSIIQQVQSEMPSDFKADLSKEREMELQKLLKSSDAEGKTVDNSRIIKGITKIRSKEEFFELATGEQNLIISTVTSADVDENAHDNTNIRLPSHTRVGADPNVGSMKSNGGKKGYFYGLPRRMIKLCSGAEFELNEELTEVVKDLSMKYLPSSVEESSQNAYESISQTEQFAQERKFDTKEDFLDFVRFLMIYKKGMMKDMEKKYHKAKIEAKECSGGSSDDKCGIEDSNERKHSFLKTINKRINESNNDLKKTFDLHYGEVSAVNQDGGLRFLRDNVALNAFYHSLVIDGLELTPRDFFCLLRRVANDERLILNTRNCENFRRFTYRCRDVGMFVNVVESGGVRHLESVSLTSEDDLEK